MTTPGPTCRACPTVRHIARKITRRSWDSKEPSSLRYLEYRARSSDGGWVCFKCVAKFHSQIGSFKTFALPKTAGTVLASETVAGSRSTDITTLPEFGRNSLHRFRVNTWIHWKREDTALNPFRHREVTLLIPKKKICLLKMQRCWIVQSGFDASVGQLLAAGVTILGLNHVKMIDVATIVHLGGYLDVGISECFVIRRRRLPPLIIPTVEILEFYRKNSTLNSLHAHI